MASKISNGDSINAFRRLCSSNVLLFAASSSLESSGGDGGELGGNGSNSSLSSPLESESCGGLGAVDT